MKLLSSREIILQNKQTTQYHPFLTQLVQQAPAAALATFHAETPCSCHDTHYISTAPRSSAINT
jgi:hypothetical protein